MPESISDLRKEFQDLVSQGEEFFKGVRSGTIRGEITSMDRDIEWEWEQLSDDQQSQATEIRHRLRLLLARFAVAARASAGGR